MLEYSEVRDRLWEVHLDVLNDLMLYRGRYAQLLSLSWCMQGCPICRIELPFLSPVGFQVSEGILHSYRVVFSFAAASPFYSCSTYIESWRYTFRISVPQDPFSRVLYVARQGCQRRLWILAN